MKTNHTRSGWRWAVRVLVFSLTTQGVLVGVVRGQDAPTTVQGISAPLYIGNLKPILDPFGRPLPGAHAGPICSLVELRVVSTTYGVIPPHTNGMSHPTNPLLTPDCRGGVGLNTSCADNGLFCMVLPQRPGGNVQVFARTYNAPTAAEATFYADSEPVNLSQAATSELVLTFQKTRPIDWGDADGDGLVNSWERLLGTDQPGGVSPDDWDGDGMSDLHEMLAGTDPTNSDSRLAFCLVQRETEEQVMAAGEEPTRPVRVSWQSVPGKTYQLEHVPMLAAIDPETGQPYVFKMVDDGLVTAGAGQTNIERLVRIPADALTGTYRVKLVQDDKK